MWKQISHQSPISLKKYSKSQQREAVFRGFFVYESLFLICESLLVYKAAASKDERESGSMNRHVPAVRSRDLEAGGLRLQVCFDGI